MLSSSGRGRTSTCSIQRPLNLQRSRLNKANQAMIPAN
jgi:hypothetical protein